MTGFNSKRQMAADKLQEPAHCQCEACINGNIHDSDCSVHNDGDALPVGPCDCNRATPPLPAQEPLHTKEKPKLMLEKFREMKNLLNDTASPLPAQPAQEPVAYVTGMSFGRFIVEPLNRAMVLPVGMALYSAPQENK